MVLRIFIGGEYGRRYIYTGATCYFFKFTLFRRSLRSHLFDGNDLHTSTAYMHASTQTVSEPEASGLQFWPYGISTFLGSSLMFDKEIEGYRQLFRGYLIVPYTC